jgi:hypothetical protein
MDRRRVLTWATASAPGVGLGPAARAVAVTFTGDVETALPTDAPGLSLVPGIRPCRLAPSDRIARSSRAAGLALNRPRPDVVGAADATLVGVEKFGKSKRTAAHVAAASQMVAPGDPAPLTNIPGPGAVLGWTPMAGGVPWASRRSRMTTDRA